MAEPLSSSDIWRIQRGFGVSELASPEEKKRFADAGVAPLTTGARQRFEEGRGISPMAGATEKEAWVAAEVMAGQRDPMELPKAYGGLGERPKTPLGGFYSTGEETAYGRRQRRMQESWDAQYKMLIDQQEAARLLQKETLENANRERNFALQERQESRLQAAEIKAQDLASKISDDADQAMNELLGGTDASGNTIAGLDPDDPNYMQRRNELIKKYPKAPKDEAFKLAIATTDKEYFDTVNFNQQLKSQEESSGRIIERQVAAEERAAGKQAGIREEERVKEEERGIKKQESDIDKLIRSERQKIAEFQGQPESPSKKKSLAQSQNKILDLRVERADLRGLYFEDQDALNAVMKDPETKLPAGTEVYIGRQKNIIR